MVTVVRSPPAEAATTEEEELLKMALAADLRGADAASASASASSAASPSTWPPLLLAVENCTEIFGNRSVAQTEFNVTCLDHAPVLTHQVRGRELKRINSVISNCFVLRSLHGL